MVALCASVVLPASAEARQASTRPLFGGPTTTASGSYLNLTPRRMAEPKPPVPAPRGLSPSARATVQPRVVCGMTLLPGDPAVDPGIFARVTRPAARPTIRVIEPTMCGDTPVR